MASHTHLTNPPLREALLDVQLAETLPASFAEELKGREVPGYKYVNPIKQGQFSLQYGPSTPAQVSVTQDELLGARFQTVDGARIALLRRNGISYSVVGAYKDWEDLRNSARQIWQLFCGWIGKLEVNRLALRYINVVEIPVGADFDEYLVAGPEVPGGLPQLLENFFERVIIPFQDLGARAMVTQATEPKPGAHVSVVLDIDVQLPCKLTVDDDGVWDRLDRIRDVKNLIFFSHLTEKALEPYR